MKLLIGIISLIFHQLTWAQAGAVTLLKGAAFANEKVLKVGDSVNVRDTLKTMSNSYLKLEMVDATVIQMASLTNLTISSYSKRAQPRKNSISLIKGKLRVLVKQKAEDSELISFKANQISLGVRGTEFMLNAYESGGAQAVDTLLLKGELEVSGASFENFTLEKSQYFNSQAIERRGLSAVKKLETQLVRKILKDTDEFLPELRLENGHLDLSKFFSQKMLGIIPSGVFVDGVGSVAKGLNVANSGLTKALDSKLFKKSNKKRLKTKPNRERKIKKKRAKRRQPNKKAIQGVTRYKYNLRREKWDIRDAVLNRKSNIKNNICFYYVYKKLDGAETTERFRRERRCNEFENE